MVMEEDGKFRCEACLIEYKYKKTAQKCEDWCNKHKSCNLEIIREAI